MISLSDLYSGDHDKLKQYPGEYVEGYNKKRKRIMKELIEKKIKDAEEKFEKLKAELAKVEESQQKVNAAREQLTAEANRLQGEYRGFQAVLAEIAPSTPNSEVTGSGSTEGQATGSSGNADGNGNGGKEGGRILDSAARFSK